jgi:2-polyprenyl-3-methyl-5-hydroxy-6-metoxy-1,4-benzoquinol methylase
VLEEVKNYYGKVLKTSADLQTNACCTGESMPERIREVLGLLAPEVVQRYYGCGLVVPAQLQGLRVLDLGCGAGRDVYLLSRLVGEEGAVVGVDMTREQLDVAESYVDEHTQRFGYERSNVSFVQGELEKLDQLGLQPESFDLIVSNCVINLCVNKDKVLRDAWQLLKPGGEMYFSDVYADRRVPKQVAQHPVLYSECLGGALYWNDLLSLSKAAGFLDPRLVSDSPITVNNPELSALLGDIRFFSATYRLFKLDGLDAACEDYGQAVIYKGTIDGQPAAIELDKHHRFEKGRAVPVCGNTWRMLNETRFRPHFDFIGDMATHFGIFADCGTSLPFDTTADAQLQPGGCC